MTQKYLELTQDELDKVAERKQKAEATKITPEWRLLAEFGYYYGYEGIKAVRENEIEIEAFNDLLAGARKVWAGKVLDLSTSIYTAVAATKSKKPNNVFNSGLERFIKEAR